jgi:hypothetical protein
MASSAITGPVFSDNKRAPAGTAAAPSFAFNDSTGTGVYLVSPGVLGLSTAGVQRVVVDSAGNVGIGTASPTAKLHVDGGLNGAAIFKNLYNFSSANYAIAIQGDTAVRGYISQTPAAGGLIVSAGSTYYGGGAYRSDGTAASLMALGSDGAIRFTTNFGLTAGSNFTPTERLTIDTNTVFKNGSIILLSSVIGPGAGTYPVRWNSSSGVLTYGSSSRLVKDQIEDIPYGLASVLSLQPRKYFRTDDQKEEIGFIADEVQSIIPEVVPMVEKKVFTKDEQDTELIPGGVNYDKLTAVLVKAIQELEARLAALEAK